jgi:hypothetical protein
MIGIIPNPTPRIGMSPVENTFGRAALLLLLLLLLLLPLLPSEHPHYCMTVMIRCAPLTPELKSEDLGQAHLFV